MPHHCETLQGCCCCCFFNRLNWWEPRGGGVGKAEERHCITFMRERRSDHWSGKMFQGKPLSTEWREDLKGPDRNWCTAKMAHLISDSLNLILIYRQRKPEKSESLGLTCRLDGRDSLTKPWTYIILHCQRRASPSLISLMVSVDVKHHVYLLRASSEFRSCVKVEVAVLGFPA